MNRDDAGSCRVRVIKLIWWVPHYRVPIFRRLCQNPHLDFTICAGDDNLVPGGARVASAEDVGRLRGINWRRLRRSRRLRWFPFRDYEWQPEAVWIAWREDFDVLITLGNKSISNWLARFICRLRGIPSFEWTQGLKGPDGWPRWLLRRLHLAWANGFLLYGRFATDFFAAHGIDRRRLFTVHNSLEHGLQTELRKRLTADDLRCVRGRFGAAGTEDRLVFFSGRFEHRKRLDWLLHALAILRDRGRRVVGVLIGEGRDEPRLRAEAKRLQLGDRALFYGPCYEEQALGPIICAADLCVAPQAVGLVVMHSFVYGTPVLTCENSAWTHGPEVEAIVEGETGGFYRDGDVNDLADKMETMLYPKPVKDQMLAECIRTIDEGYTPQYQERVIIQALNAVLPPRKRIPPGQS